MTKFRLIISAIILSLSALFSYLHVNYFNNAITLKLNYTIFDNRFRDEINDSITYYLPEDYYLNFRKTNEIYFYTKADNKNFENFKNSTNRIINQSVNDLHVYYDNYLKTIEKYLIDNSSNKILHPFTVSLLSKDYFDLYSKAIALKSYGQIEKKIVSKMIFSENLSTKPIVIYLCYMLISLFCVSLIMIDKIYLKLFNKNEQQNN